MILYMPATCINPFQGYRQISLTRGLDFGEGIYLYTDLKDARNEIKTNKLFNIWNGDSYIHKYEFKLKESSNILDLSEYSNIWFDKVINTFRIGNETKEYDLIFGQIVSNNANIVPLVSFYEAGFISGVEDFLRALNNENKSCTVFCFKDLDFFLESCVFLGLV